MRRVTVVFHREDESWWAESPDLPGFSAAADSRAELEELVSEGVSFYLDGLPSVIVEASGWGVGSRPTIGSTTVGLAAGRVTASVFAFQPSSRATLRTRTNPEVVTL